MPENSDPTKDSAFKKVVDYFLRTPPQPKAQSKREADSGKAKERKPEGKGKNSAP